MFENANDQNLLDWIGTFNYNACAAAKDLRSLSSGNPFFQFKELRSARSFMSWDCNLIRGPTL
jgi:hypothetical protein